MENILEVKNLGKKYKGFSLKNVSFSLPPGYVMGLIGPNGAGKTTIIKLIMNLICRDCGEIRIFGQDNLQAEAAVKGRIGFVYDLPSFYQDVALRDIKHAYALFYEKWDEALFTTLCGEFGLPLKKKFKTLSAGMKTKLALALALALSHDADLFLMDEPTTGLDPVFRRELLKTLREILSDEQKSILFSTHITSDLERIADYITYIREGKIFFSASREKILEDWGIIKGGTDQLTVQTKALLSGWREGKYGFEGLTTDLKGAKRVLRKTVVYERIKLEDIVYYMK